MKVLWKQPGSSVGQVRAGLSRPLAYTTVMTVLDRMSAKGLVGRRKNGRAWLYSPLLDREAARRYAVGQLVANLFDDDPSALARYVSRLRPDDTSAPRVPVRRRPKRTKAVSAPAVFPSRMDDSLL